MKPSEILDNAANLILRDGWTQGVYYRPPDEITQGADSSDRELWERLHELDLQANRSAPCCQAGAILRATIGYAWNPGGEQRVHNSEAMFARSRADRYMNEQIRHHGGMLWHSTVAWNDADGRTAEEVVEALRGAAAKAREAGE